jgi:hypothetical protein
MYLIDRPARSHPIPLLHRLGKKIAIGQVRNKRVVTSSVDGHLDV